MRKSQRRCQQCGFDNLTKIQKLFTALTSKAFGTEIHSLAGPGAKIKKKKKELKNSL